MKPAGAAAPAARGDATAGAARARVDRVVVHAHRDAADGARLAERIPAALEAAVRGGAPADADAVRALIERAVREAAR